MDWSNLLVGIRATALNRPGVSLEVSAAGTRFSNDAVNIPARTSQLDLRNRFARIGGGLDLVLHARRSMLAIGVGTGYQSIENRITPRFGDDFQASDRSFDRLEVSSYIDWSQSLALFPSASALAAIWQGPPMFGSHELAFAFPFCHNSLLVSALGAPVVCSTSSLTHKQNRIWRFTISG